MALAGSTGLLLFAVELSCVVGVGCWLTDWQNYVFS